MMPTKLAFTLEHRQYSLERISTNKINPSQTRKDTCKTRKGTLQSQICIQKKSSSYQLFSHVFSQCKLVKAENDRLKKVLLTVEIVV